MTSKSYVEEIEDAILKTSYAKALYVGEQQMLALIDHAKIVYDEKVTKIHRWRGVKIYEVKEPYHLRVVK